MILFYARCHVYLNMSQKQSPCAVSLARYTHVKRALVSAGAECLKRALLPRGLLLMPSSVSTMSFIWEAVYGDGKPVFQVDDF